MTKLLRGQAFHLEVIRGARAVGSFMTRRDLGDEKHYRTKLGENGDGLDLEVPGLCQKAALLKSDLPATARPATDRLSPWNLCEGD